MNHVEKNCMTITAVDDMNAKYVANSATCTGASDDDTALVFCMADALGPIPGENLPKMPCIPPLSRRKRETNKGNKVAGNICFI